MMRLRLNGATVLDVGANKGIYCYWMMRAVGRSGRVLAFEPQPEMRDDIEKHTKRLSWLNLKVINGALSNFDGVSVFLARRSAMEARRLRTRAIVTKMNLSRCL